MRRRPGSAAFAARLEGRTVSGVGRRGKYLLFQLGGQEVWVVHLGMSGQLLLAEGASDAPTHTHLRAAFADGLELRFVDPRTFGECFVSRAGKGGLPELAHLGFEPLDDPESADKLASGLARTHRGLKVALLDQRLVAGIGNIYSDEILHMAGLRWDRPGSSLDDAQVGRLHRAMVAILSAAIDARGSTLADSQYRDLDGRLGGYQAAHRVYARQGQACGVCGTPIERIRVAGRSSFFCPSCQT